jgi:hypothetical protein
MGSPLKNFLEHHGLILGSSLSLEISQSLILLASHEIKVSCCSMWFLIFGVFVGGLLSFASRRQTPKSLKRKRRSSLASPWNRPSLALQASLRGGFSPFSVLNTEACNFNERKRRTRCFFGSREESVSLGHRVGKTNRLCKCVGTGSVAPARLCDRFQLRTINITSVSRSSN